MFQIPFSRGLKKVYTTERVRTKKSDLETKTQILEKEIERMDLIELSSNEIIESVQVNDSTVEIVGYIDSIESPQIVKKDNKQYKVFKFCLNNGNGKRIQVVAWDDQINKIEKVIILNHIILLDGAQAREPKNARYNKGNVSYELLIRRNTDVSKVGEHNPNLEMEPVAIELSKIMDTTQRVVLQVYVKSNFSEVFDKKRNITIGCGSITDGDYKVEVHIINFTNNQYSALGIRKGDKIEITGLSEIQDDDRVDLTVDSIRDIKRINGVMERSKLAKATRYLKKKKN